ncbi:hypothetical protein LGR54_20780 [Ancylobacter sp. Lp-2]|uniref:hypothetical protein n=1 Tax=Ancylobacter sp. Lp-2 TaxID=2881339 RepID=UPI001E4E8B73|nr:hypothetical protein [Ancylobacter sp. Lp-2]MCB4771049.1 hypothetical protein [Ancylobacter sp. Lp-2]
MSALVEPRLVIEVDDILVRYFDAPSGEDWPYLGLNDILALTRSNDPEGTRRDVENDNDSGAAYSATADGLVVVVPRAVAYGLIGAAIKVGLVHASVFDVVEEGVILAANLQLADLTEAEKLAWTERVHARNGGLATPTRGLPQ